MNLQKRSFILCKVTELVRVIKVSSKLSYLQKYLSTGDGKETTEKTKKKKKKKKAKNKARLHAGDFKIIDDVGFGAAAAAGEKEKSKESGGATKYVDKGERPRLKEARKGKGSDSDEDELSYATLEDRPRRRSRASWTSGPARGRDHEGEEVHHINVQGRSQVR